MSKILVAEDDRALLENLGILLEAEGYEVYKANDGIAALQIAKECLPDLIVCDVMMPGMDGYTVLRELRAQPKLGIVPFIFMSARSNSTDVRKGMLLGADDYLFKPFEPDGLINAVRNQLEKRARFLRHSTGRLDTLREQLLRALPRQLGNSITSIAEFANFLYTNADSLAPLEIHSFGQNIYYSATRVRDMIENYLMFVQIEVISRDKEQLEELRRAITEKPASVISVHALMCADRFNRLNDMNLAVMEAPLVRMAYQYLGKVIEELVDFAFRLSKPGTQVKLTATYEYEQYRLTISHQSPLDGHSQRLNILQEATHDQVSGLGLLVAKRLIELHDGKFEAAQNSSEGILFCVTLP